MACHQKRPQKRKQQPQSRQPYDNALKALMEDHAAEVIPEFIPEAAVVIEQNNEIRRENLRADLVYLIHYRNQLHVLNMELQTDQDSDMPTRMLRYHVELHFAYSLPVISVVLYLFEASIPTSPYREESGEEELLTFHYRIIALWTLDAQECVKKRIIGMYTFLPGMKGANASLLIEAIKVMRERYTQPRLLARHLARFKTILYRSRTLSEEDKQRVEHYMQVYDSLIDQDPYFQQRLQQKATEVEIGTSQQMVLDAVNSKFPALMELARERVALIRKPDALRQLVILIFNSPDENTSRWLLNTFSA